MKKLILLLSFFVLVQLWLINQRVVYGETISNLEKNISDLREENQKLEIQIANFVSYSAITQRANGATN